MYLSKDHFGNQGINSLINSRPTFYTPSGNRPILERDAKNDREQTPK